MKRSIWVRSEVLALALLIGLLLALVVPLALADGDEGGNQRSDSAVPNLGPPAQGPPPDQGTARAAVTAATNLPIHGP